jgi:hypothetical protein
VFHPFSILLKRTIGSLQQSFLSILQKDTIIDATIATLKEKLAALESAPSEQRKLAAVLLMDIADHTTLTVNLDPEEQMDAAPDSHLMPLAEG